MIILGIFIFIFIFIILSSCTLLFHPKPRNNVLNLAYSSNSDSWLKKEGNKNLLILLHGMYSSPKTFEEFSYTIIDQGWDIYMPVLPNSANSTEDLISQGCYQWDESLKVAFQKILKHTNNYQKIVLGGHSQGGAIALTIAPSFEFLDGVIAVASPVNILHKRNSFIRNLGISLAGFLHFITPNRGLRLKSRYKNSTVEDSFGSEDFYYGLTLHSMNLGLKQTKKHLKDIYAPTLLIYEKGDRICNFDDYLFIKNHLSHSTIHELIFETPADPHSKQHKLFSYKPVKQQVFQKIQEFLSKL